MKKVYLVTIPANQQGVPPTMMVVEDLSIVTGKYPYFMIQEVEYHFSIPKK